MAAEDDLIAAHRQHIEDNMASVRDEMNLLSDLDSAAGGECEGGGGSCLARLGLGEESTGGRLGASRMIVHSNLEGTTGACGALQGRGCLPAALP